MNKALFLSLSLAFLNASLKPEDLRLSFRGILEETARIFLSAVPVVGAAVLAQVFLPAVMKQEILLACAAPVYLVSRKVRGGNIFLVSVLAVSFFAVQSPGPAERGIALGATAVFFLLFRLFIAGFRQKPFFSNPCRFFTAFRFS